MVRVTFAQNKRGMIQYKLSWQNPTTHYLHIQMTIPEVKGDTLQVQMPAWRPGRYELGNFAKNVQHWRALDGQGKQLPHTKRTKDLWEVETQGNDTIHIHYNLYAVDLNAGSTYLDELQLQVNPVNALMFVPGRHEEECRVELQVPDDYQIATQLQQPEKHVLTAPNFDFLADSPLIASDHLKHETFDVEGTLFHLWFQGTCRPDWQRIKAHFTAYTKEQIELFGSFPCSEYHYLYQIPPYSHYHGVEHLQSTMIVLGPGFEIMDHPRYDDFLGVSSHELFHTWNIKALRPKEMYPYDFTKENYSTLGYVAEGVTTWYGDYMLLRSGVWQFEDFCVEITKMLQRHFHNYGRHSLSVAESSWDTWLDGYVTGAPNRKVSIYHKGAIAAWILDVKIRKKTSNQRSLDTVMRRLYDEFAQANRGYTDADYQQVAEEVAGRSFADYFRDVIRGTLALEEPFREALQYLGLSMDEEPADNPYERYFGFKVNGDNEVLTIAPDSPAEQGGLMLTDKLLSVNGFALKGDNLLPIFKYYQQDKVELVVESSSRYRTLTLMPTSQQFFPKMKLRKDAQASTAARENYRIWAKQEF